MKPTAAAARSEPKAPAHLVTGRVALVLALSLIGASASAQLGTPGAAPAASTPQGPAPLRRQPNLTGPTDAERSMNLDNEKAGGKVVPQLQIPIGRRAGAPVFEKRRATPASTTAPGPQINDGAARCESETDKVRRAACLGRTAP